MERTSTLMETMWICRQYQLLGLVFAYAVEDIVFILILMCDISHEGEGIEWNKCESVGE